MWNPLFYYFKNLLILHNYLKKTPFLSLSYVILPESKPNLTENNLHLNKCALQYTDIYY